MKVIELLNKIANGEITEIPRFIFEGKCYNQCNNIEDINIFKTYYYTTDKETEYTTLGHIFDIDNLNNEITIEEDKKIEKIDVNHLQQIKKWKRAKILGNKINEIIDYLEEKE